MADDAKLEAARRAAKAALRDSVERSTMRLEMASLETTHDAWARYAISLEQRVQPPEGAEVVGARRRPMPLPPSSRVTKTAERSAAEIFDSCSHALQVALGSRWSAEREVGGLTTEMPLIWLEQLEVGCKLLQSAAQRERAATMAAAEERVRADAAVEELELRRQTITELEGELAAAHARLRELEGTDNFDEQEDEDGRDLEDDGYEPFQLPGETAEAAVAATPSGPGTASAQDEAPALSSGARAGIHASPGSSPWWDRLTSNIRADGDKALAAQDVGDGTRQLNESTDIAAIGSFSAGVGLLGETLPGS